MKYLMRWAVLAVVTILLPQTSQADLLPANGAETAANFAEISVLEDRVRIALEIDFDDMPLFLARAEQGTGPADNLSERSGKAFKVFADGTALVPETRLVEVRPRKERVVAFRPSYGLSPQDQRSPQVVYVVLEYGFEQKPRTITFTPPLTDKGVPTAAIGVIFDHLGVAVTDYRYLSRSEVFYPNWKDPWYSKFENPNLTRHHKSALMSFVTVEPREVRHEVIFRLRDLEAWTDVELGDATSLNATTMEHIKKLAIGLFSKSNPLIIEGQAARPASARVEQLSVGVDGLKVLDQPAQTDRATAILGIILSYPRDALPQNLSMAWNLFTEDSDTVPVQISDPAGAVPGQVTTGAPEISWTNYILNWSDPGTQPIVIPISQSIDVPLLSLSLFALALLATAVALRKYPHHWKGCAAVLLTTAIISGVLRSSTVEFSLPVKVIPDGATASQITEAIVSNLAAARLETEDSKVSHALSSFVASQHTQEIKVELNRGLTVALPSGANARAKDFGNIVVEDVKPSANGGDQILARWDALVSGGHWGHMHQRVVSYRAVLDVEQIEGAWFLSGLTILEARMKNQAFLQGGNS
ncbi:hypothetical protein [Ruegeria sp. Ofav3-42]|uniref:hypothetical protein n=1 Tax=Ruegeria sp. Ofav3-42 TaxID=2917759 RepID=UPI001EF4F76E|nr:hypothetical protein [Ruegeria sp. Ofav3-42]MCG7521530.1 hypothetical protein [Ruegeria sp. Ofav3-42]